MLKINGKEVEGKEFAFDGCHKIYIIEDENDKKDALKIGYDIYDISELEKAYNGSCPLRFINNWKLTTTYASQGTRKAVKFVYDTKEGMAKIRREEKEMKL